MKVLLATQKPFAPVAVKGIVKILKDAGYSADILEGYAGADELKAALSDVQALIVRSDKVTEDVLACAPSLKVIVRAGAGYDNIDLQAASRRGIVVMNTPGQNSNAVAELALGMMIYMARNGFTPSTGSEISGKTLGIQAFGNVGRLVGAKARALGMGVKAFDPWLPEGKIEEGGAGRVLSLEELYSTSDFVSIHIPATPQTTGSIGASLVGMMPEGGVLVNTARKEVIDEDSLLELLRTRKDLKYATDCAPDRLEEFKALGSRFFATPKKMGAQTAEANVNSGLAAAREIVEFFTNGDTRFQVNR
ncbi:MAG: 3-phosphoglycerate dehydrogenase [Bacteroidales bacterium]|nr:3-phosphoglycerate dehydrogenase [Bacteroidales bacterium]